MKKLLILFFVFPLFANAQIINTIAGIGTAGLTGDSGPATAAQIHGPSWITFDAVGNCYFADRANNVIRKISTTGIITRVAGTGVAGFSGDGGPATAAELNFCASVALDASGNMFIADYYNARIRKVNPAGIISTYAGTGIAGFSGDGGPAIAAQFDHPYGLAFDVAGNLYVADEYNHCIRKINTAGTITSFAGTGTISGFSGDGGPAIAALLYNPHYIYIDVSGNMIVTDNSNFRIREISTTGIINTIAGTGTAGFSGDGGPALLADINFSGGTAKDASGNLYITDAVNNRIRVVNSAGIINTYAGTGAAAFGGDGGPAITAQINLPHTVAFDPSGNFYIADYNNNRIRKILLVPVTSCDTLTLADTITACANDTVHLLPTLTGSGTLIDVKWTPAAGLSDSSIMSPMLNVGNTSHYEYITVRSLLAGAANLVVNGDFSLGNAGFSSSYTYAPGPSSILNEGYYSVYTDPHGVHSGFSSFPDHTTGTGNMLIINGGPSPVDLWCQTISVTPNTDYDFSAWAATCSPGTTGIYAPILQFKINGVLIGTPDTINYLPGVWNQFHAIWNSGASTTATICIYNLVVAAAGNDFVLDDISFRPYCTATDSIYVKVSPKDTALFRHDTAICPAGSVLLSAPVGYTSRVWNTGSTATTITVSAPGIYWALSTLGCSRRVDTFHVRTRSLPVVNLGNDTSLCFGNTVTLTSAEPVGSTFLWSTGSTANPITVTTTGYYWLAVTDSGCTGSDTVHVVFSPAASVLLGPDTANCDGIPVVLHSTAPYTSPVYLWNNGSTSATITAGVTGTYWLQVTDAGCPGTDTIHVSIIYDTLTLSNRDTAVCLGKIIQTFASANPFATYQWLPTAGIAFPNLISPTITPDTSAMYSLVVNMVGCPPKKDSFFVDVQPYPQVYLGGNRIVCAFDTLHLTAVVSPGWYGGYSYSWVPATYLDANSTRTVVYTAGNTQNYILTVSTSAGCAGIDSSLIIVQPGNFLTVPQNQSVCPYDTLQLTVSGGTTYHWHPALYLSDSLSSSPYVRPVASQTYTVVATSAAGCTDTGTFTVNVWPAGVIFLGDSLNLYPGESYHIVPQTNCTTFSWFPAAGLSSTTISDPVATPGTDTKYIVYGITENGCITTDSIDIFVGEQTPISVPNAFTPGNGVNSSLFLLTKGAVSLNYFRIFNRWGNMVFETKKLSEGWDGTYKGTPQMFGVYIYDIQALSATGNLINLHGNITLLR